MLAGALAGALSGLGARLAMRAAAWVAGPTRVGVVTAEGARVGELTWSGTFGVVIIGAFVGITGAALYLALRPLLPTRRRGLAFGAAALILAGWTILDPANPDLRSFGSPALNYAMFAALFLLYAVALVRVERWLDDRASRAAWSVALWLPIAGLASMLVVVGMVFATDRHPSWGLAALAVVLVARVISRAIPRATIPSPRP